MAKIWKGHRGGSTRSYNDECLKEEAAAERGDLKTSAADLGELKTSAAEFGQLKTSTVEFGRLKTSAAEMGQLKTSAAESRQLKTSLAEHGHLEASATERRQLKTSTAEFRQLKTSGTGFSSSFKSATLLQSHHWKSQSEDDYESDQPLDLSSSKSKWELLLMISVVNKLQTLLSWTPFSAPTATFSSDLISHVRQNLHHFPPSAQPGSILKRRVVERGPTRETGLPCFLAASCNCNEEHCLVYLSHHYNYDVMDMRHEC